MKFRKNRKGFTIVELIIVIAVIGVLTAVLVPTIVHLVNKANRASDQSLVSNLNKSLAMRNSEAGEDCKTMHEAVESLEPYGYKLDALVTKGDQDLLFNLKQNKFYLADAAEGEAKDLWKIQKDLSDQTYNIYAGSQFSVENDRVEGLTVGFDAGFHDELKAVTYARPDDASDTKSVVIRTNGDTCVFTVESKKDHVEHYGYAYTTNVVKVNSEASYHEYGTSKALVVTEGKVVIEETGVVFNLSATSGATATVSNNGGNVMESSVAGVEGSGTFEIKSLAQLEAFRDATNSGETFEGKTINLNSDIKLNKAWKPISNYSRNKTTNKSERWFQGTFDGKEHTISGLTNVGLGESALNRGMNSTSINKDEITYGLFASVYGATIKNLKLTGVDIRQDPEVDAVLDCTGALFGYMENAAGSSTVANISNISVSGSVSGDDNIGGVFGRVNGSSYFKAENITVETGSKVSANLKPSGLGQVTKGTLHLVNVAIHADVANTADATAIKNKDYAATAGLSVLAHKNNNGELVGCTKVILSNCSFDGTLTNATKTAHPEMNISISSFCASSQGANIIDSNGTWNASLNNPVWVKE